MSDLPRPPAPASSMRTSAGHDQPSQEIDRKLLRTALTNATNHARMAQRVVAVLMLTLSRSDRLDAILGVPTRQIMQQAMSRVAGALRPDDRIVQLTDEKLCVMLPNLRSDALPLLAAGKIQQAFETPFSFEENSVIVRPCIGIASFPAQAANGEELLVHADMRTISPSTGTCSTTYSTPMTDALQIPRQISTMSCATQSVPINLKCITSQKSN